jgi:hypothetical protein
VSTMRCLHCRAETRNGLALCDLCQRKAETIFEFLPVYFRNLARWRPGRAGSRPVPGSRVLYDGTVRGVGTGDRISDTLDEVLTALTTWARVFVEQRSFARPLTLANALLSEDLPDDLVEYLNDNPQQAAAGLCTALEFHLVSIATLDWCGEFVTDLSHHEERLRALTETSVPGWYAGSCRRTRTLEGDKCGTPTYVVPGLTWVTCGSCGATTHAAAHLDAVIDEARSWVARPKALAEAVVALVDDELSVPRVYTRIRQWAHQGTITPIRFTTRGYAWNDETKSIVVTTEDVGHARYQLGDVLDRVLARRDTQANAGQDPEVPLSCA